MPQIAHSISLSEIKYSYKETIDRIWRCMQNFGVKGGGYYSVKCFAPNDAAADVIASHEGVSREGIPTISESYGDGTYVNGPSGPTGTPKAIQAISSSDQNTPNQME